MSTLSCRPLRAAPRSSRYASRLAIGLLPVVVLALGLGCGDESLQPVPLPGQADLYWDLELNHHAVTLSTTAPYDTLQLVATPRNFRAEPLAGLPAAEYRSSDPERVIVTAGGVLVAVAPTGQPVAVVTTLTANNLKHVDTVLVSVVDEPAPPTIASFSIHPLPPDSAKVGMSNSIVQSWDTLPARIVTATGENVPVYGRDPVGSVPVHFRSADTTVAVLVPAPFVSLTGVVRGVRRGAVTIYGSSTVFGHRMADTLPYRIGWPAAAAAFVVLNEATNSLTSMAPSATITTGGVVGWFFTRYDGLIGDGDTLDITFADAVVSNVAAVRPAIDHLATLSSAGAYWCSADCDSGGNFLLSPSMPFAARYFPVPGTYEYHSARTGLSGRVTVVDEP